MLNVADVPGVARAYGVDESSVKGVGGTSTVAQVSLLRWSSSSDPFCTDLFGAHLHTPLAKRVGVTMEFGILLTSVYDATTDARQQRREHEELVATAEQLGSD